jgi:hypothetical protein
VAASSTCEHLSPHGDAFEAVAEPSNAQEIASPCPNQLVGASQADLLLVMDWNVYDDSKFLPNDAGEHIHTRSLANGTPPTTATPTEVPSPAIVSPAVGRITADSYTSPLPNINRKLHNSSEEMRCQFNQGTLEPFWWHMVVWETHLNRTFHRQNASCYAEQGAGLREVWIEHAARKSHGDDRCM